MGNKIGKYDVIDNLLVVIFIAILAIGCNTCNSIQSKERIEIKKNELEHENKLKI